MLPVSELNINKLKSMTFIDLFAGIGGFHQALSSFGAQCIYASEFDSFAADVYEKNYGIKPAGDITKISEKDIPQHDILCAGFPCQAFSISGKQRGFDDTRGTLFFDVARIAAYHKPKIIFLENVSNFAKHDNGKTLEVVKNTLNELGYNVFYKVLNAGDFGIPQNRSRIYILGFHSTLNIKYFQFPVVNKPSILENILLPDDLTGQCIIKRDDIILNKNIIPQTDIFGQYPQRPIRIGLVGKGGQGERIYHPKGHAITLSAYGGGVGAKTGLYDINDKIRRLVPRECARLMGFPDNFIMAENTNQAYKQFGNGVVIDVLQYILNKVDEVLAMAETKEKIGSRTAKGGFEVENKVVKHFNDWQNDLLAQEWLKIMGYDISKIENIIAVQIPTRIKESDLAKYRMKSVEDYNELQKYKKADVEIQLFICFSDIVKIETISVKKSNKNSNFNQVDKRSVDEYKKMWNMNESLTHLLKLFTGEIKATDNLSFYKEPDKRLYLSEFGGDEQNQIIKFFSDNKYLIVSDILKGRGGFSANWIIVCETEVEQVHENWKLVEMNKAINFLLQGPVQLTPRGSLAIGRVTMQRKGGTPDPTSLQFKMTL